jgi:pyruvate dehydrogenase E2 component (dihydrolipoamide acetyltransferase)
MTQITMPRLSDSMEEGTILSWLKEDGAHVEAGDDLLEIETDKATVAHPAELSGTLEILAPEGTTPVGAPIARIGEVRETSTAQPVAAAPVAADDGAPVVAMTAAAAAPVTGTRTRAHGQIKATPVARRVARAHHVSLQDVTGSGPLGRVTRNDVLAKLGIAPADPRPPLDPAPASSVKGDLEVVELSRVQSLIARRMGDAKATVPHFQVQTDVVMDATIALRAELKAAAAEGDIVPSVNDMIVRATAVALRRHPRANASFRDGRFELHRRVNVGVAVAGDEALVVPTVFDADRRSLGEIARVTRELAGRVRSGQIRVEELEGGTFTVSNLGMYGMTAITPVINPPQAGILGVGAVRETLARVNGEIVDRALMTLTLSCDHRILYGADAARLLGDIRDLLESPLRVAL